MKPSNFEGKTKLKLIQTNSEPRLASGCHRHTSFQYLLTSHLFAFEKPAFLHLDFGINMALKVTSPGLNSGDQISIQVMHTKKP